MDFLTRDLILWIPKEELDIIISIAVIDYETFKITIRYIGYFKIDGITSSENFKCDKFY